MRLKHQRRRDEQAWIFDLAVKQTGRVQGFEYDERQVPSSVKSYAMIPKHMGRRAQHQEAIAAAAEKAGHPLIALRAYWQALNSYHTAQHAIHEDDDPDKIRLYERLSACFDRIIALSPHPIERQELDFEGNELQAVFAPLADGRRAPCVLLIPGMDGIKERMLNPTTFGAPVNGPNIFHERGLHVVSVDGPGLGISNLRKIRISAHNFDSAMSRAIDFLVSRPEVDKDNILVMGTGMAALWAIRTAAHDRRVRAVVAGPSGSFGGWQAVFEQASPRYKRVFMYMAGIDDEEAFDREIAQHVTVEGCGQAITCPALLVQGEFDPMSPLEDAKELFDELKGPKEMWVLEDDFHGGSARHRGFGGLQAFPFMIEWLVDAIQDRIKPRHKRVQWIAPGSGTGPY